MDGTFEKHTISSGVNIRIKLYPNYLPGCVWKNFTPPSIGSKVDSTDSSSSNSQVLYLKVIDPIFKMAVYNPNSTTINGKQMKSTFVLTYTSPGLDNTTWGSILQRMKRQSRATAHPNPMHVMYMFRIHYVFKGMCSIKTSEFDDYLSTQDYLRQLCFTNVPNTRCGASYFIQENSN